LARNRPRTNRKGTPLQNETCWIYRDAVFCYVLGTWTHISIIKRAKICTANIILRHHADSESSFFSNWRLWSRGLNDFKITTTFLWITPNDPWAKHTDEDHRVLRRGKRLKNVTHTRNIPLKVVNKHTIWSRYDEALRAMKIRNQNKLRTLENQASRTPTEYEDVNDVVEKVENMYAL
jgi:hypothetical protein